MPRERIWFSPEEIAEQWGVCVQTVRRFCRQKRGFPCMKVGKGWRIHADRAVAWFQKQERVRNERERFGEE